MSAQRITTEAELAELRSTIARSEAHATRLRERATRPSVEDIGHRLLNARERVPAGEGKPIPAHVTAEAATALHAILTNRPDAGTRAQGAEFESCWCATESAVESFYEQWPELRWFDLLAGVSDALRKPADDAAAAFTMATAPGLPAIVATSRPSQPWVMRSLEDFDKAFDAIEADIHCDLQVCGPSIIQRKRYRHCVDWFASLRYDDLIVRSFTTFPVARGDLIVLVRVCCWCMGAFQFRNGVNGAECVVEESYSDGFGSLPFAPSADQKPESDCSTAGNDDFTDLEP